MYTRVSGTLDSIGITNIAGLQSMYRARRCFNLGPFSWISHIDCDGDDDGWFLQRFERDVAERDHTAIDWPIDGAQQHVRLSLSLYHCGECGAFVMVSSLLTSCIVTPT